MNKFGNNISFTKVSSIAELANLANQIWHEYWPCILSSEQIDYMVDKFQSKSAIISQIKNENYIYFYILFDEQKAGYFGLSKKEDYLFLSKLYLKNNFRGVGLGYKSFEFIKDFARKLGCGKITLTVNKNNKNTINAYIRWGLKIVDSVVSDIGFGFVMDDYIMEYDLLKAPFDEL